eukprot:663036-Pelagomonas_calceolata.AAC.5
MPLVGKMCLQRDVPPARCASSKDATCGQAARLTCMCMFCYSVVGMPEGAEPGKRGFQERELHVFNDHESDTHVHAVLESTCMVSEACVRVRNQRMPPARMSCV